jgi:hypothetical protein
MWQGDSSSVAKGISSTSTAGRSYVLADSFWPQEERRKEEEKKQAEEELIAYHRQTLVRHNIRCQWQSKCYRVHLEACWQHQMGSYDGADPIRCCQTEAALELQRQQSFRPHPLLKDLWNKSAHIRLSKPSPFSKVASCLAMLWPQSRETKFRFGRLLNRTICSNLCLMSARLHRDRAWLKVQIFLRDLAHQCAGVAADWIKIKMCSPLSALKMPDIRRSTLDILQFSP